MTSIELFRKSDSITRRPDWGTGKDEKEDIWLPRAPTWQNKGVPLGHNYQSTALHLSNVRDNDELVPTPQSLDITKKMINKPFPAEHPYASHIEKFAMIPKFDSPNDPKRGVAARNEQPINDEMSANPYDITVVKKIKGFPYRYEIQALPTEGQKKALYWQGENYFDQQSKIHGNKQQFYPIPPKQIAPNLQDRPEELQVCAKSQNVLRNIERNQWIPSQKLDYTGLGPANPMGLDNLDCKMEKLLNTGNLDDKLYPRSVNTFDPARPMEGRLRKLFAPKPSPQTMVDSGLPENPQHRRLLTLTEREEDRLLNGKEYVNLPTANPADPQKDMRWKQLDTSFRPEPRLEKLNSFQQSERENGEFEVPDKSSQSVAEVSATYLDDQKDTMHKTIQGIEAQNRWKVLENGTPDHDISQIKEKYKLLKDKEMPATFYRHEGRYNEERAGLYKTSYDPARLANSMNSANQSGGVLFNTSMSHVEASQYPTVTWDETEAALGRSNTVVFKNSELSGDRPSTSDMLNPYREWIACQRASLQPTVASARPRIQEKEFVLREDTYGDSYNTKKFLQDNKLDKNIRQEPLDLISHENQNLERTRERVAPRSSPSRISKQKSVHFCDNVDVQNFHENIPIQVQRSHTMPLTCAEHQELDQAFHHNNVQRNSFLQTHPERSPLATVTIDTTNQVNNLQKTVTIPTVIARNTEPVYRSLDVSFTRDKQLKPKPLSETTDVFRSLSTNFMPSGIKSECGFKTSSSLHFPVHDLAEKKDLRFNWEPGCGNPRPQTCLLEMQDNFIKSEVRKKFHKSYPEQNPEIRMNINTGNQRKMSWMKEYLLKVERNEKSF